LISGLVACVATAALVGIHVPGAYGQTVTKTFVAVQCSADVNGTIITQSQDISTTITAPDNVDPGETFTVTIEGGSASLPTSASGLQITSYSNLSQTFQINGTNFNDGSIINPGTGTLTTAGGSVQTVVVNATLPAPNQLRISEPGPFPPGTLTVPDISVMATAPAEGSLTINMVQLTTTVKLSGVITAAATCNVPNDTIITIPIGPGNTPPSVDAGPDVSGDVGDSITLDGTVTDPDNTPTLQWAVDSPFCSFADATAEDTTISCTKAGVFAATLTADDGVNAPIGDTAQVTVLTPNVAPTVDAGPDVAGEEDDDIALSGSVTDPDNSPAIQWSIDGADCTFSDDTSEDTVVNCGTPGTYIATLTADDGINSAVSDAAVVTVTPTPPGLTVKAGPDVEGAVGDPIVLQGKITDPGYTFTSLWTVDSPDCSFASPVSVVTTITCTNPGVFAATLTGHDGVHPDEFDTALVAVVEPNTSPVVSAGPDVTGLKDQPIALDGTVTDPDNTPAVQWTIDSPSCSFGNASAVDTTVSCTATGIFAAALTADDGVNPPVSDVAIVTVLGNLPPVVNAGPDVTGMVGDAIALDGTVTDPDNTPTVLWSTGSPNCTFASPTAVDTTITCTAGGFVAATLTAFDGVNAPVSDTAIVRVNAPNTPPTVYAGVDRVGIVRHAVTLDATVSDPDNPTPSVKWANGSPSCSFGSTTAVDTTFVCNTTGVFAVTLTVDDGVNPPVRDTALVQFTPVACVNPCISIGDSMSYEGGSIAIPISLSTVQATAVTFTATIVPVNATNGVGLPTGTPYDFKSAAKHNMKIGAGARFAYLTIVAVNDASTEPDEMFNVLLSNAAGVAGIAIGRSVGVGVIKDATGIGPGQILIGSQSIVEIDTCGTCKATAKIPIVLSAPSATTVSLKYSTLDAGATSGVDYTKKTNAGVSFLVGGALRKLVTVITLGDVAPEPTEGIDVKFTVSTANAAFTYGDTGRIDILDND
jgi:hypothetical protein